MKQIKGKVLYNKELLRYPVSYNKELLRYQEATFFLMHVQSPGLALDSKPGQFFMLQCSGDMVLRRPISIHSVKGSDIVSLLSPRRLIVGKRIKAAPDNFASLERVRNWI